MATDAQPATGADRPFDASAKGLIDFNAGDWVAWLGFGNPAAASIEVINPGVETVLAVADRVIRVEEPAPHLLHLELQSTYDPTLPQRLLRYNVFLDTQRGLSHPVKSVAILLRRQADGPALVGRLDRGVLDGFRSISFDYEVVRLWRLPARQFLRGGLATLPLATLANLSGTSLRTVVHVMQARIERETTPSHAKFLWSATELLMGVRYSATETREAMKMVVDLRRDSSTYRAILEEGQIVGSRGLLIDLASRRFGRPGPGILDHINSIDDYRRIVELAERIHAASSWRELISDP